MFANLMSGIEVVLPRSDVPWLLSQPDNILNANVVQKEFIASEYTILHEELLKQTTENQVVRRELTRRIATLTAEINDELQASFDDQWGKDTENWKKVNVYDTIAMIVARTTNRIFVGLPLCKLRVCASSLYLRVHAVLTVIGVGRNEDFIINAGMMAQSIPACGTLIRFVPRVLQPYASSIELEDVY
jgi:hypothetical protein